jgi:redox-sensitive bicupin YhaK (pirin superfamily)
MAGKALGLPYVDVEGFSMHPHRGFDILTYIMDGSDGFQHRDSLNKSSTIYRGGTAQFMRTGSGVLHEEFWETRPDRRTDIELFQLWINLPALHKMDEPVIEYIGKSTDTPWIEETSNGVQVRHVGSTLNACLSRYDLNDVGRSTTIDHVTMKPGATWTATATAHHSALLYVREGTGTLGREQEFVKALQTATFHSDGGAITIQNADLRKSLDFLFLAGVPLCEPVAMGGPIVMNTQQEINDAYRQLQNGTFLKRHVVLREHGETLSQSGRNL